MEPIKIKFGTDGWRSLIAADFTTDNVRRIAKGLAQWMKNHGSNPQVVLGYDCRFAGELFAEHIALTLAEAGIKVLMTDRFVTTPMVSLGTKETNSGIGVILTASHNPASYHGFKVKGAYGGPMLPEQIKELEALIPDDAPLAPGANLHTAREQGQVETIDLEEIYLKAVRGNFDLDAIRQSGLKLGYDAMYGSGQAILPQILPEATLFRCEHNPTFHGISPEPILRNLSAAVEFMKVRPELDGMLVNDGDADRIGLLGPEGEYIDSHHIMLILIHYLVKYKGWTGKVATGFSSTVKIAQLCEHYGLDLEVVPIGFKHICDRMLREDILMGGEESGGIAVKGFLPERDGIWNGLTIFEGMAVTDKSLRGLLDEIEELVGAFAFERIDLRLPEDQKQRIVAQCKAGAYQQFGDYAVSHTADLDGFKYYFNDSEWVMIRPSGTEPVLRTYAESHTKTEALAILKATHETILKA